MIFTDDFLEHVKLNPLEGVIKISEIAQSALSEQSGWTMSDYEVLLEAFALIEEISLSNLVKIEKPKFSLSNDLNNDCINLKAYLVTTEAYCRTQAIQINLATMRNRFRNTLQNGFVIEFTDGDLKRVQVLINELRALIAASHDLETDFQRRLLARLEKLQSEMHKKISDVDRLWGFIGDAGVVMGKLGNNAKPIVDRIRELTSITWQTQAHAEQLPSGTDVPLLGHTEKTVKREVEDTEDE